MVLGCPNCILGEFRIFFKNHFQFCTIPWQFSVRILKFLGPKSAQNGLTWCMENPEKSKILTKLRFLKVVKKFKILAKNGQEVVKKNEKNLEIFQKHSKLSQNAFWVSWHHHNLQKPKFPQNLGFSRFPITTLGHFGLMFGLKISKPLQKMAKERWKNEKKIRIFSKIF